MFEETFQDWLYENYIKGELSISKIMTIMENEELSKHFFDEFLIEWVYLNQHEFMIDQFIKFLKRLDLGK